MKFITGRFAMSESKRTIIYRADIDGLRALAVLAVVFYHLDVPFISGGFVGVDVFFVISGFLIGGIIHSEIQANCFSLHNFYIRRIRRIFPALFFIVFLTSIAALVILPKLQLGEFSQSVISVAWFVSNFFFWFHNDYFSVAAELKPLLHTWSLSVEEQFYIFFPLLMLILNKRRLYISAIVLLSLMLLSFLLSFYLSESYQSANFYLAATRAWEFLAGVILATGILPAVKNYLIRQYLSLFGLGLLLSSMILLDAQSVFPGVNAIYPVLGTFLLIYSGSTGTRTWTGTVLSSALFRYIGLISYSLYLWHWPVIALLKSSTNIELDAFAKGVIFILVLALSVFTYRFVEQPFRKQVRLKQWVTLKMGLVMMLLMSVLGYGVYYHAHYIDVAQNVKPREQQLQQFIDLKKNTCFFQEETLESVSNCSFGDKNSDKIILLWGDSHALALYPAFDKLAKEAGWRGIYASFLGCPPLFDVTVDDVKECDGRIAQHIKAFVLNNKIDQVFLVARWNMYEKGWIINNRLMKPKCFVSDKDIKGIDRQSSTKVLHKALANTLKFFTEEMNIRTSLVLPTPVLPDQIDKYKPEDKNIMSREAYLSQRASIVQRIKELNHHHSIQIVDPLDIFCPEKNCQLFEQGEPLYLADDNHLSLYSFLL